MLGVGVDTWLYPHPNGPAVFVVVGDLLEDRWQVGLVEVDVTELLEETSRTNEIGDGNRDEALDRVEDRDIQGWSKVGKKWSQRRRNWSGSRSGSKVTT